MGDGRLCFNVGIHCCGVAGEEEGARDDGYPVEEGFEGIRVSKVGLLMLGNGQEHLSDVFAKSVRQATDIGADWASWPSAIFLSLVDFVHDVELPKRVFQIICHMVANVLCRLFADGLVVFLNP